jgi:hypothetical protein
LPLSNQLWDGRDCHIWHCLYCRKQVEGYLGVVTPLIFRLSLARQPWLACNSQSSRISFLSVRIIDVAPCPTVIPIDWGGVLLTFYPWWPQAIKLSTSTLPVDGSRGVSHYTQHMHVFLGYSEKGQLNLHYKCFQVSILWKPYRKYAEKFSLLIFSIRKKRSMWKFLTIRSLKSPVFFSRNLTDHKDIFNIFKIFKQKH